MSADFVVFLDGGCTANPGELAVAAVVCTPDGELLIEQAIHAGKGTNNVSEYRALRHAICMAHLIGARRPLFCTDSMLVVQQINGFWAMKGDTTSPLHIEHGRCQTALMEFDRWTLKHIPRERNKRADWLVCKLLGHGRTVKNPPGISPVESDSAGKPGWSQLGAKVA